MTGIIILAAGSSTRMGQAKQNLLFKGQTLLQTAVKTALASKADMVIVVLGGNCDIVSPTLVDESVKVVFNADWGAGMGTSISYGLDHLLKVQPKTSSALFMLSDQPFVDVNFIEGLLAQTNKGKIVASAYGDTSGPPVLFDQDFFTELLLMEGTEGAKKILQKHREAVIEVSFPNGAFDIDTPEDYERLSNL